jgi:hypothetical protein
MRADYGRGAWRRRIRLVADGDRVRGELADDFHHFAVELRHDGQRVVGVRGEDVRVPWTTCPGSVAAVQQVVGLPLSSTLHESARAVDLRSQCTHLFDLASLAIAHARRQVEGGAVQRIYDAMVPDRREGAVDATLARDGSPLMRWRVEGVAIIAAEPPAFSGRKLAGAAFHLFTQRELSADDAEAASVFRRALFIGLGRQYDFERIERAETFAAVVGSACHTFSAERVGEARRVHGSVRDFDGPEHILDRGRARETDH